MAEYVYNQSVRISTTFYNSTGVAADPTTVKMVYKPPSSTKTTLVYDTDAALNNNGTGAYYVDLTLNDAGIWRYRWEGTGNTQAATEGELEVRPPGVTID